MDMEQESGMGRPVVFHTIWQIGGNIMKRIALAACVLGAVLAGASLVHAEEDKELRAIIGKAIKAHGGRAKLAGFKALIVKGNGKFHGLGEAIDFGVEITSQGDRQVRYVVELKIMNQDIKISGGINGNKGWEKVNDELTKMSAEELAEHQEQMHCDKVLRLLALKDQKTYQLSALGEVQVGGQPAVGVRVSRKGHRDVNLFFDKAKGHLVKSEFLIKDMKTNGDKEITQTTYYSDYKEFQGTRQPTRFVVERDGKKYTDTQVTDFQLLDKVDNSTFDQP
jgi:hypothetical protein